MNRSGLPVMLLALAALAVAMLAAFTVGRYPVPAGDLLSLLWSALGGTSAPVAPTTEAVVLQVRGPRVLAAALIGAALSVSGAAFQGLFRNPLVSPDILGASAGAALGAVLGIFLSLGPLGSLLAAFGGGLLAVGLVYLVGASNREGDRVLALLLGGMVIGSLLAAGIGLLKTLADPRNQLPAMTFWLLGSLAAIRPADLVALLATVAPATAVLMALRWRLNVLSQPDEEARALGAPTRALRLTVIAAATCLTAATVATAGIIGWIGLVVPHLARALVGPSFARLLPVSALLGAGLLLLIDTMARSLAEVEIPLGILTAVVGTPVFLLLLRRAPRGWS